MQAATALRYHFRDRQEVLVAMELLGHYMRGDNKVCLQPDVQVLFGVPSEVSRSSYKACGESKAPDFVLKVASPSTAERGAELKAREYVHFRVREYWRFDPDGSLMGSPLEGYIASGGRYGPVKPVACKGRHLRSGVLGLDWQSQTHFNAGRGPRRPSSERIRRRRYWARPCCARVRPVEKENAACSASNHSRCHRQQQGRSKAAESRRLGS